MKVELFAPASIGNVSVGFDVLGAAIAPIDGSLLGDIVVVESNHHEALTVNIQGEFAAKLPPDPTKNIIYHCYVAFNQALQAQGITPVPVSLTLHKNMPIGSGLGSSACSIVAALDGLNQFYANPLSRNTLLGLMGQMEAVISGGLHYDNVAPCYLGGLQLMLELPDVISQSVPCFENWYWVVAYPGIEVSTAQARALLPEQYPRQTLISHSRHLAAFIHACHSNQPHLAASMLKDVVAEPYRQTLLPNFVQTMATAKEFGMLASGISGSGPTIFAVTDNLASAQRFSAWLSAHYLQTAAGFVHICQLDKQGSRPLTNRR